MAIADILEEPDNIRKVPSPSVRNLYFVHSSPGPSNAGALGIGATFFGCIHLIAWNFSFPSRAEELLLKTSALITTFGPGPAALVLLSADGEEGRVVGVYMGVTASVLDWVRERVLGLALFLSLRLSRLFLIVEAFRSPYFLPPDVYLTTWAANAPHAGRWPWLLVLVVPRFRSLHLYARSSIALYSALVTGTTESRL